MTTGNGHAAGGGRPGEGRPGEGGAARKNGRASVLVTAASAHGATAEIARAIGNELAARGLTVDVLPPEQVTSVEEYDAVILGSAVYAGHWLRPALDLVDRSRTALARRPVWLFSSGPVGDPSGRLSRAMGQDPVDLTGVRAATRAREHRMFPGKLDPKSLSVPQRAALLAFRGLRGDFRDWGQVRQWATALAEQIAPATP